MELRTPYLIAEQEARGSINRLILEELTVSDDVAGTSDEVFSRIVSSIELAEPVKLTEGGYVKECGFRMTLFGDVSAVFTITDYDFADITHYRKYSQKSSVDVSCGSSYRQAGDSGVAMFWINYVSIKGKPMAKLMEDLHHELNHVYQQHSEGDIYQDNERYSLVSSDMCSKDVTRRDVARLLYLCNPSEQDSFVGSVYSFVKYNYLVNRDIIDIDTYLKETEAYVNICELRLLYRKIVSDRETYRSTVLDRHGFVRWDRFDKRVRNAIERSERKFAMCVKKCKKDFLVYEGNTWCDAAAWSGIYLLG